MKSQGYKKRKKPTYGNVRTRQWNDDTGMYEEHFEEQDIDFYKVWMEQLIDVLDRLGGQKIKVLCYILRNMNYRNNQFVGTQRAIVKGVVGEGKEDGKIISLKTVNDTMKLLMVANIIRKKQNGIYVINPDFLFKGFHNQRDQIICEYRELERGWDQVKEIYPAKR